MKKRIVSLGMLFAVGSAFAVPSFDPFADATADGGSTYEIGNPLVGQTNATLAGAWYARGTNFGTTQPAIVAGNLAYPGLPDSTGNSVSFEPASATSACIPLGLATGHQETVYYSFKLKITDLSAVPTHATNNPFAAFLDDPSLGFTGNQIGRLGSRILTRRVGDGYVLGISKSANTADFVYEDDSAAHNVDEVVFVVACYQRIAGVETNVNMWINPSVETLGGEIAPPPTLETVTGNTALNNNSARAFGILCQFPSAPAGVLDDVRVATSWKYVTGNHLQILQHPISRTLPEGSSASFSVVAEGTAPLSYQWIRDGFMVLSDGGNISGVNSATLNLSNITPADAGSYAAYVTNGFGDVVLSDAATLALSDPIVTLQPESRTNDFGTTATFTVAVSGTGPFTYRWQKEGIGELSDGGRISGSQTPTLTLTEVEFLDFGNYWVQVTGSLGVADSQPAALTVNDPLVVAQPVSVTNAAGDTINFHVVANGTGQPFSYQWYKNGAMLFGSDRITGAFTDTLTITDISAGDEGSYAVTVTGAYNNSAASAAATLTVISPVSITAQPLSRTVAAGEKTVLAVAVAGTEPFFYQWQFEGAPIGGANAAAHVVPAVHAGVVGTYRVVISNSVNSVTSSVAAVSIAAPFELYETNLVVIRVGDGAQTLTMTGNSIFLDQFTPLGTYVNSLGIPDSGSSAMITFGWNHINQTSGTVTGSGLTRSLDGRFMVVAGYNTPYPHTVNLNTTTAAAVPRGIGLINSLGHYTLPVASTTAYNNTFWRAAVTDGTNNFWGAAGAGGTYYFGFDSAPATVQNQFINIRGMGLFNGNIYVSGAVAGNNGILKLDGMPTIAVTPELLFAGTTGTTEMEVSPDGNLIYVADDRAVANGGGIQRWEFDGFAWTLAYTLSGAIGDLGPRYVTADFSGSHPVVYAITKEVDNNRIVRIEDTGAGSVGDTVAYAGANQVLRGIRFGPVATAIVPQPNLAFSRAGDELILSWSGNFILLSAPNVGGPYTEVVGATSPHTNNLSAGGARFFGLGNPAP